jgi:hypothetical protein
MTPECEWIIISAIILISLAFITEAIIFFAVGIDTVKEAIGIFLCALILFGILGSMVSYGIYQDKYKKIDVQVHNLGGVVVLEINDAKIVKLERAIVKHNGKEIVNLDCIP